MSRSEQASSSAAASTEAAAGRRRLSELLGARVTDSGGRHLGHVNDVRLVPLGPGEDLRSGLLVEGIVVADRHAGSTLGYDRRPGQGPALVRWILRAVHPRPGYATWRRVESIDWASGSVAVLPPLGSAVERF